MKNLIEYKGMFFYEGTEIEVMETITDLRRTGNRVRIFYGDKETGVPWNEENDVIGRIGRSTGTQKIPLLIFNAHSFGGGALLTGSIVKIVDIQTKKTLYQHENFYVPTMFVSPVNNKELIEMGYTHELCINGENFANCKTEQKAIRLMQFMKGERFSK